MKIKTRRITFACKFKPLASEEKDKYLALASLEKLKSFIPPSDSKKNPDLLPVAFNLFIANRVNANGQVIDTKGALEIADNFANKPINVEHERTFVIGTIVSTGFSEFGTDKPLTRKEVASYTKPFNVTCGGFIWKSVHSKLAEFLQECSDSESENFEAISASWEVGFNGFNIAVFPKGKKNLEDAKIIEAEAEIDELMPFLKSEDGSGVNDDGEVIAEMPVEGLIAIGAGFTENPAAEVKGILTATLEAKEVTAHSEPCIEKCSCGEVIGQCKCNSENKTIIENDCPECKNKSILSTKIQEATIEAIKNSTLISQTQNPNVTTNIKLDMKINVVQDITDENLKTLKASSITDFISQELSKAETKFNEEKAAKENEIKASKEIAEKLKTDFEAVKASLEQATLQLTELKAQNEARAKQEKFSSRMASFDEKFELTAEDRQALASQIKDVSDEAYTAIETNLSVLMAGKKKGLEAPNKVVTASVVAAAIENGAPTETQIPNSSQTAAPSIKDRVLKAFGKDSFQVVTKN